MIKSTENIIDNDVDHNANIKDGTDKKYKPEQQKVHVKDSNEIKRTKTQLSQEEMIINFTTILNIKVEGVNLIRNDMNNIHTYIPDFQYVSRLIPTIFYALKTNRKFARNNNFQFYSFNKYILTILFYRYFKTCIKNGNLMLLH